MPNVPQPAFRPIGAPGVSLLSTPAGEAPSSPAAALTPAQAHLQRMNELEDRGSGISQIHSPWARIPLQILDALGSTVLPAAMMGIPGTSLHHQVLVRGARGDVTEDEALATGKAQREHLAAESANQQAEAQARLNPPAKEPTNAFEAWWARNKDNPNVKPEDWLTTEAEAKPDEYRDFKTDYAKRNPNATAEQVLSAFSASKAQPKEGELRLGAERVAEYNKLLPPKYALAANATEKDLAQRTSLMEFDAREADRKGQAATAAETRRIAQTLAQERLENTEGVQGRKWVMWPGKDGRPVAGPASMAKSQGAADAAELPAQEVRDVMNARHAVTLMTKQGDPKKPETQGVLQLIDSLDKDGKLGVLAARYNRFLTQRVGTSPDDDPRIITLIDKNMLSETATMLAHFGASGGRSPQMLQHFLDLANAGRMDGVTLRAGTEAIADYMKDRAMIPEEGGGAGPTPKYNVGDTVTYQGKPHRVKSIDQKTGKLTLEP